MKKLITLLLALTMALSMAACASDQPETDKNQETVNNGEPQTETNTDNVSSALEVLENIWAKFPENEQFPVSGGNIEYHMEQMEQDENYIIPNAPGNYEMEYAENLPYVLYIPEDQLANIDEAATMIHGMLANNFSAGVVHVKDGADVKAMASAIQENLAQTQWICGTPEQMLVAVVGGEYLLVAFGIGDAMTPFQTHMGEAYPEAETIYAGPVIQ